MGERELSLFSALFTLQYINIRLETGNYLRLCSQLLSGESQYVFPKQESEKVVGDQKKIFNRKVLNM